MKLTKTADEVLNILNPGEFKPNAAERAKQIATIFKPANKEGVLVTSSPNPVIDTSFKVYDTPRRLNAAIKKYNTWVNHPLPAGSVYTQKAGNEAKERYELYCCGWLDYYDREVRNKETDHAIYFIWTAKTVVIKIWPKSTNKQRSMYLYVYPPGAGDPPKPPGPPPPY